MILHLNIIGIILIVLALMHVIFPRYFNWKSEFQHISLINKEMMYVHTFFIAVMVLMMGILCLSSAKELVETDLGQKIALGIGVFWSLRLVIQFFGYSSELWKNKPFETFVHIIFSILWTYLSFVFLKIGL